MQAAENHGNERGLNWYISVQIVLTSLHNKYAQRNKEFIRIDAILNINNISYEKQ